jgi:chlorobactene glucosyltransferase
MTLLAIFVTVALGLLLVVTIHNALAFPRLKPATGDGRSTLPAVSILIPARNESSLIGETVRAWLGQDYPCFEVIILDDHSQDGTAMQAKQAGCDDPRLSVHQGDSLPHGWLGKNWACHQLAQLAQYDYLLFTDADVRWEPGALAAVVSHMMTNQADLLTVWPTQITVSWGERLVVPLMALAVLAYLPVWLAHHTPYPAAAAANGQCLLVRRRAYEQCGGHAAVRSEVVEDVRLAKAIKRAGLRLRMTDGAGLVQTRMYHNWRETRNGYAKNILAGHGNSPPLLLGSTLFHLLIFVGPWVWLMAGFLHFGDAGWPLWPAALISLGFGIRALTAQMTRQRICDALFLPISVLLMTWTTGQALWWRWRYGGPLWKGRVVRVG